MRYIGLGENFGKNFFKAIEDPKMELATEHVDAFLCVLAKKVALGSSCDHSGPQYCVSDCGLCDMNGPDVAVTMRPLSPLYFLSLLRIICVIMLMVKVLLGAYLGGKLIKCLRYAIS